MVGTLLAVSLTCHCAPIEKRPLCIGDTFIVHSKILGEERRINVYVPPPAGGALSAPLPVLYMPDGGVREDFLHVAGLVQVLVGNGTMRPFLLVGIENTERRRDMTGPSLVESDRSIAPRIGGAAAFRSFLKFELMPQIRRRYHSADETAIVGESLAGLFVVETFLFEPDLFDTYLAFDPSLWWNNEFILKNAESLLKAHDRSGKSIFLAASGDSGMLDKLAHFDAQLGSGDAGVAHHSYQPMPQDTHATIYHPAALIGFRRALAK
ncbi:MAG: alpha/beta hydrolase-fold protein [Pseudomonadota bacterium]|nr:alpha/beta hydrolase-fold protein [Pseudomonadota bacterium]